MPRNRGPGSGAEKRIANRYRRAGYKVRRNVMTRRGEIDIIARRGRQRIAVESKAGKQAITAPMIRKFVNKSKGYKKVVYRTRGTHVTSEARKLAKKHGVRFKVL